MGHHLGKGLAARAPWTWTTGAPAFRPGAAGTFSSRGGDRGTLTLSSGSVAGLSTKPELQAGFWLVSAWRFGSLWTVTQVLPFLEAQTAHTGNSALFKQSLGR